jgi:hypothetical protein
VHATVHPLSDNNNGGQQHMITPQEAATLVDWPNPSRHKEIHDFILSASAREIQLFVHSLQIDMPTTASREWLNRARIVLDIRLAEDAAKSAGKLERFTYWLVCLTIALVFIGVVQIIMMFCGH